MAAERTDAIAGGCHCGNLCLELQWPAAAKPMRARACGCSFCTKHGGVWTSHPAARLVLRMADSADATRYRFGTGTAEFHVCRACGAVPAVTCVLEGRTYAVVNVNCLEGVDPATLDRLPTDFEGEAIADRLPAAARAGSPRSRSRPGRIDRRAAPDRRFLPVRHGIPRLYGKPDRQPSPRHQPRGLRHFQAPDIIERE